MLAIDLGCGRNKRRLAFGFDCRVQSEVNAICNIVEPFPLKINCIDVVHLSHVMEHILDLLPFMEEVFRVCKPGAEFHVAVPYYTSRKVFSDPTQVRYITEDTFKYFEAPADYGVRRSFRIESVRYETRKPFRFLPEYFSKWCRRHLWSVVDHMYGTHRVVKS